MKRKKSIRKKPIPVLHNWMPWSVVGALFCLVRDDVLKEFKGEKLVVDGDSHYIEFKIDPKDYQNDEVLIGSLVRLYNIHGVGVELDTRWLQRRGEPESWKPLGTNGKAVMVDLGDPGLVERVVELVRDGLVAYAKVRAVR